MAGTGLNDSAPSLGLTEFQAFSPALSYPKRAEKTFEMFLLHFLCQGPTQATASDAAARPAQGLLPLRYFKSCPCVLRGAPEELSSIGSMCGASMCDFPLHPPHSLASGGWLRDRLARGDSREQRASSIYRRGKLRADGQRLRLARLAGQGWYAGVSSKQAKSLGPGLE